MRILKRHGLPVLLLAAAAMACGSPAGASGAAPPAAPVASSTHDVTARLISDSAGIAPGKPFTVALEFDIRPGWHTYWRNPGDSGEATRIQWNLPPRFSAAEISWTRPHRFEIPPLVNFGYERHVMHLIRITPSADLKAGSHITLTAKADWLVCSDICIPESAALSLALPVTPMPVPVPPGSDLAARFADARARLPEPSIAPIRASVRAGQLMLSFDPAWNSALTDQQSVFFFPYDEGSIDYPSEQKLTHAAGAVELALKLGYAPPKSGPIGGVIVANARSANGTNPGVHAWEIAATFTTPPAGASHGKSGSTQSMSDRQLIPGGGSATSAGPDAASGGADLPALLLFAVLGGVILNLMPCVFPVLSIKAVGLAEQARHEPAKVRAKGLSFAAGVIASMLALAVVLLALRSGGEQIGWGFQLQSPLFVTLMAYLLLAVGLNLSGVFEFGGGLAGTADALTRGHGLRAAFFTGVLTTLVATPCSAPYMAAAVGAALTQSMPRALLIFIALGFGLSLPYLALCFVPGLRRLLPRPGAWMDTLKQLLAFPMYASAAWLLWVLAQQTSSYALAAAFAGCVLIALAAWAFQKSRQSAARGRFIAAATAVLSLAAAVYLPWHLLAGSAAPTGKPVASIDSASSESWQPYDPAKVAALDSAGAPVLVNFTASWCLTCLVNERTAFSDPAVQALFRRKGVILVKGDWTNRDPVITAALTRFGRAGVPLYLAYNVAAGQATPRVLPQLLTASLIRETFARVPNR